LDQENNVDDGNFLSWVAGLFEGEGTVTISWQRQRRYTQLRVMLTSVDTEVIALLQRRWPGKLYSHTPKKSPNAREAVTWCLQARRAASFLAQIEPFVRTGRVRAKVELALQSQAARTKGNHEGEAYHLRHEEFKRRMHELNRRGTPAVIALPERVG
jgi:hypothetical protein